MTSETLMRQRQTRRKPRPARAAPIEALDQRLRFDQPDGAIRFDGFRMMLMYSTLLARLKHELVTQCGVQRARDAIERLGHAEGTKIALLANEHERGGTFEELMAVATQVWSLTGNAQAHVRWADIRPTRDVFEVELELTNCVEAKAHVEAFGPGREPVCWLQTGAASGLCTAHLGRPVLFKEVECVALGHPACRLVGKRLEAWGSAGDELTGYLRADDLINRFALGAMAAPAPLPEPFTDVVGIAPSFVAALEQLRQVAPTQATVLLSGETGTGKELFARLLHKMSERRERPFVAVNCAAVPDSLAEAELFGVERGAYTGAHEARTGRFERAAGGTLFLDEIASLSLAVQAKLLRVLEDHHVERLGGARARPVDVRVVAACNEDLRARVQAGTFREDLYFRLSVFPIHVPPLRERRDDIPLLVAHFLRMYQRIHRRQPGAMSGRTVRALLQYDYPGNVRELEHLIERAVIRAADGETLDLAQFDLWRRDPPAPAHSPTPNPTPATTPDTAARAAPGAGLLDAIIASGLSVTALEGALLERALERSHGNRSAAARALGLSRRQFNYRIDSTRTPAPPDTAAVYASPRARGSGRGPRTGSQH